MQLYQPSQLLRWRVVTGVDTTRAAWWLHVLLAHTVEAKSRLKDAAVPDPPQLDMPSKAQLAAHQHIQLQAITGQVQNTHVQAILRAT